MRKHVKKNMVFSPFSFLLIMLCFSESAPLQTTKEVTSIISMSFLTGSLIGAWEKYFLGVKYTMTKETKSNIEFVIPEKIRNILALDESTMEKILSDIWTKTLNGTLVSFVFPGVQDILKKYYPSIEDSTQAAGKDIGKCSYILTLKLLFYLQQIKERFINGYTNLSKKTFFSALLLGAGKFFINQLIKNYVESLKKKRGNFIGMIGGLSSILFNQIAIERSFDFLNALMVTSCNTLEDSEKAKVKDSSKKLVDATKNIFDIFDTMRSLKTALYAVIAMKKPAVVTL